MFYTCVYMYLCFVCVSGELDYNICIMDLSDKTLSDDRLQYLLMVAPEHSIILLEDIDGAYFGRDLSKESKYLTMLSLLVERCFKYINISNN